MTQKALLVDRGVRGTRRGEVEKWRLDLPFVAKLHSQSFCCSLEEIRCTRSGRHEVEAKANEIFDLTTGGQQQRIDDLRTGNVSDEVEIVGAAGADEVDKAVLGEQRGGGEQFPQPSTRRRTPSSSSSSSAAASPSTSAGGTRRPLLPW